MLIKLIIIVLFLGILFSLGKGLFHLVSDKSQSSKTVKALSWRIGLSIALFAFLMIMIGLGVIKPHGITPPAAINNTQTQ